MFSWALISISEVLFFIFSLYLVYVYVDKKDISFAQKLILGVLFLPIVLFAPTKYNLPNFNIAVCEASENSWYVNYTFFLEILVSVWIIIVAIHRYVKADINLRKQIRLLVVGIILFLLSFFTSSYIATQFDNFKLEQYGLFGMVVFMGFLAYLIVKFRAFNIKLLAAQALVAGLLIGIGSQFFFIQNPTNRILNAVTFCLALGFGYMLVHSVKLEVQRKEELENLSTQLAAANDKLHILDKAKSEFISIASHQLRTPLTSIKGFGSLLLEGTYGQVSDAQKNALEKIYISNERLIHLVEDLLNISRIEAGRMEFDFQEAQIEDLVNEAVTTLELSAKQKNLYLHWQKPAVALPKLKIDITKIKEVISNMVDNAIKYTQKGGVTVRVESGNFFDHGEKERKSVVRVIVSDTGIGMGKEELESIFNKFERGKQVSHYHTDGTGLGMYVGKKMVEAHKGRIWAESEGKNKGSRFILELPVNVT
jgi:signal transduction histidine kinase